MENTQSGGYAMPGPAKDKGDPTLQAGPSIIVLTQRAPGANVINMVEAEKKILPDIAAAMPPAVEMHVVEDKTQTIRASVLDVEITLLITVVLVVIVIFLFLRNVRATLIPSSVIPLALLASAAIMLRSTSAWTTCRSWP
ncbi:MAG: efflux RND transporter permease subunit [Caulobacteraceae bacterium]